MLLRLERFGQLSNFASSYFSEMVRTKCFYRKIIDNLIGSTVRGGGAVGDAMGLLSRVAGPWKIPCIWVSFQGKWGRRRYHGSRFKGGGTMEDTMGLLSRVLGLQKKSWVSCKRRHGHGSPFKGGRAVKGTMGLLLRVVGT